MDCLYHKWLDTNDKTGNPIKLIFEVLNYARKSKYQYYILYLTTCSDSVWVGFPYDMILINLIFTLS